MAIGAWIRLLNLIGKPEWITDGIILIVGVHFFPLARIFRSQSRAQATIGATLIAIAMVSPCIAARPNHPAASITTGLILWLGASYGLLRARM